MKILFYTRNNLTVWTSFVLKNLSVKTDYLVVSELNIDSGYSLKEKFYENVYKDSSKAYALKKFGYETCDEIIIRCRLLKNIDKEKSLRMIGAMSISIEHLLEKFQPDSFVALRIDSYVLDLFNRLLIERNIKYIGLWKAALKKDNFFITTKGEHISISEVKPENADKLYEEINSEDFQATSIKNTNEFSFLTFLRRWLYYKFRDIALSIASKLQNDPLGYRYITSGKNVPEYKVKLKNFMVNRLFEKDWKNKLENSKLKTIFIGLQVNPESTIDYYVDDLGLINYERVTMALVQTFLDENYEVFIKDHPNMFGMRDYAFMKRLSSQDRVHLIPYDISSTLFVKRCDVTYTWTGTIGLQAALAGKCAVVAQPTYYLQDCFVKLRNFDEISRLPSMVEKFNPISEELGKALIEHVLKTYIPGRIDPLKFDKNNQELVAGTLKMVSNLDKLLPELVNERNI